MANQAFIVPGQSFLRGADAKTISEYSYILHYSYGFADVSNGTKSPKYGLSLHLYPYHIKSYLSFHCSKMP